MTTDATFADHWVALKGRPPLPEEAEEYRELQARWETGKTKPRRVPLGRIASVDVHGRLGQDDFQTHRVEVFPPAGMAYELESVVCAHGPCEILIHDFRIGEDLLLGGGPMDVQLLCGREPWVFDTNAPRLITWETPLEIFCTAYGSPSMYPHLNLMFTGIEMEIDAGAVKARDLRRMLDLQLDGFGDWMREHGYSQIHGQAVLDALYAYKLGESFGEDPVARTLTLVDEIQDLLGVRPEAMLDTIQNLMKEDGVVSFLRQQNERLRADLEKARAEQLQQLQHAQAMMGAGSQAAPAAPVSSQQAAFAHAQNGPGGVGGRLILPSRKKGKI